MPANVYIEGFIKDGKGEVIKNVLTQLLVNTTGQRLGEAVNVTNGYYSAWTVNSPTTMSVIFSKPGYSNLTVPFNVLMGNPDVVLGKGVSIPGWQVAAVLAAVFLLRKKTGKVGALNISDAKVIFLLVGGVIAFSLIKKILEGIGLWDTKDTKDLEQASTNPNSWWNPVYWKSKPAGQPYTRPITESTAKQLADKIYNAFGWVNDNEEEAISVFKSLPSRAAGSFVSDLFLRNYGQDMLSFLRGGTWPQDRLSDADVNEINQYVNKLPAY